MSFNDRPPPSVSSGDFRSLKPDFPEEGEKETTEAPESPTLSSAFIGSSQQQFPEVVQRKVPIVGYVAQAPQLIAVRPVLHSNNQLSGDGNREWVEAVAGGGSLSDLVHQNKSVYGIINPDSHEEAPGYTGLVERDGTSNGSSTNDVNFDPRAQPGFSMVGKKFMIANELLNQH